MEKWQEDPPSFVSPILGVYYSASVNMDASLSSGTIGSLIREKTSWRIYMKSSFGNLVRAIAQKGSFPI
jgi:hypothetical protein